MSNYEELPISEIISLAADDTIFFGHTFFPRSIRQDSPQFHYDICDLVEDTSKVKKAVKIFRGGAKTTLARVIIAKRISYAVSRTILLIGETAEHAYESVKWIKHAVERQDIWAKTFNLGRGDQFVNEETKERYTWRDDKIQIVCKSIQDETGKPLVITVVGSGIFGQSRGLNIEDFRPDFILLDDVVDEDNAKTAEQRRKVNERIYGAIANTLAPRSEAPNATMLFLQTPLHREDAIEMARSDPEWGYLEVSCFNSDGESQWPERWTTAELRSQKQGFINRNMLSVWLREMEVKITDDALAYFRTSWLKDNFWTESTLPEKSRMRIYVGVDPTPPPKDTNQNSGSALSDLDEAVVIVIGILNGHVYILDGFSTKSPMPGFLIDNIFSLHQLHKPKKLGFESILFARTTKYLIEQESVKRRHYVNIAPIEDKRKKSDRIRQELTDLAFAGKLHSHEMFNTFNDQFYSYPDVSHDDWLDALAIALMAATEDMGVIIEGEFEEVEDLPALGDWRGCP